MAEARQGTGSTSPRECPFLLMSKPQDHSGYKPEQTTACERLLATLIRGIGPWRASVTVVGGLVPSLLIPDEEHVGTTDIDLVVDLEKIAETDAYKTLEQNLKKLSLERYQNEDGRAQHFRWIRTKDGAPTTTVELLCPAPDDEEAGKVRSLKEGGERGLSAIGIPGAHLVFDDFEEVEITTELLDGRGVATVVVRVAGIVAYVVLKTLAYESRWEPKDAYDLVFMLVNYADGPQEIGRRFAAQMAANPDEPLYPKALEILRSRFMSDDKISGADKDGPVSYASFVSPNSPEEQALSRRNAVAAIEAFLDGLRLVE